MLPSVKKITQKAPGCEWKSHYDVENYEADSWSRMAEYPIWRSGLEDLTGLPNSNLIFP